MTPKIHPVPLLIAFVSAASLLVFLLVVDRPDPAKNAPTVAKATSAASKDGKAALGEAAAITTTIHKSENSDVSHIPDYYTSESPDVRKTKYTQNDFIAKYPNDAIVLGKLIDLDGDGVKEYVIIYDEYNPNGQSHSNLCIMSDHYIYRTDLAGRDRDLGFAGRDALTVDESTSSAYISMMDRKHRKQLEFQVHVAPAQNDGYYTVEIHSREIGFGQFASSR